MLFLYFQQKKHAKIVSKFHCLLSGSNISVSFHHGKTLSEMDLAVKSSPCDCISSSPSLDIRIVEARCLPDHNMLSKPSVYCILSYNGAELARTAVQHHTTDPHWDTSMTIDHVGGDGVPIDAAQLTVTVMEQNRLMRDGVLGSYALSLNGLVEGEVLDKWLVLKGAEACGEVRLRLKPNGFGRRRDMTVPQAAVSSSGGGAVLLGIPMSA